ncbi:MAG: hypothetical protein WB757_04125 [Candidatus Cybelea sp.]
MTFEKILARSSNGWYLWVAASAVLIVADMVIHGVTSLTIFPALLSVAFACLMFSGKRAEDLVIARYQERPPVVGSTTTMPFVTRVAILRLLGKCLWALWFVLLASCLTFAMVGDLNLSRALTEGMIVLALVAIPLRVFIAAALFR